MSLILEALKKADQERQRSDAPPNLDSLHEAASPTPSRLRQYGWIVLLISLMVLVVVLIVLWPRDKASPAPSPVAVSATPTPQPAATPAPVRQTPPSTAPVVAPTPQMAQLDSKQRSNIDALYEASPEPTPTPQPRRTATPAPTPPPVQGDVLAAHDNVKLIKALPFSVQENIPTLMYSEHHYQPNGRSYVVINGRRLQENASIEGIRIDSILEDGLLMSKEGRKFKMIALNSWINY